MSWFDATGFANLAKSALKGAQKTIDKALDIKEEEPKVPQAHANETSDFFASWGLQGEQEANKRDGNPQRQPQNSSSIWGSFSGSFYEPPKAVGGSGWKSGDDQDEQQRGMVSSTSAPEKLAAKDSRPAIAKSEFVHKEDEGESSAASESVNTNQSLSKESDDGIASESCALSEQSSLDNVVSISTDRIVTKSGSLDVEQIYYAPTADDTDSDSTTSSGGKGQGQRDNELESNDVNLASSPTNVFHRVPNVSSESDKKSLESLEILGSRSNTDCTTTPESDLNSLSPSVVDIKVNSESVEILPDSLVTSPSSVEILGDWKSDSSPYLSPIDPKNLESSPVLGGDECATPCVDCALQPPSGDLLASSSDISPYESPMEEAKTLNVSPYSYSIDNTPSPSAFSSLDTNKSSSHAADSSKTSPESVEVIPDVDEPDEVSLAEDSYTSASEGTVMTVLEPLQQLDAAKNKVELADMSVKIPIKMHDSCPDDRQISAKTCMESRLNLSLDSLKEKHNLHLTLEPITTQPIRKSDPLEGVNEKPDVSTFSQLMSTTIEPPDPDSQVESMEETNMIESSTDQYLISTDSSREGTLLESSSEDNATLICTDDSKILETPLTTSSYVKTMLADAMVEKSEIIDMETHCAEVPRENSPISSESRSDLVKIGSDQASGHTSGDELETTTSSDIEIISSPNGDSSSTQSRQSPAKLQLSKGGDLLTKTLKTRGHSRELSEISVGSDEANMEIEKLLKRVQEMTEILEARESKLIDVSRINMELHEQNANLMRQLENFEKHAEQNQNINQITDEYTQRLSALERKFQQAIRERDQLRKNLDQLKLEAASRLSSQEMFNINAEKDEIIKELREEGEKLSKQQLQHSNIIKKLRVKEKETDATIKSQKEQIEEQNTELERLKRSLHAKEEVERSQIEAVHTLTAKTKKQEKEILMLQEKLDNAVNKMEAYKKSLDAAKVDLTETKKKLAATEEELKEAVDNAAESCQLFAQVEDLKLKYRQAEEAHVKREEFFKHENNELLKRLEAAEARSEELSESVSVATKPLLRQIEQLQANLLHKTNSFMKQEKVLSEKNIELQSKVENLIEMDRLLREENVNLKSKESHLESKLNLKEKERLRLQESHDTLKEENERLVEQNKEHQDAISTLEQTHSSHVQELKREINALENKLAVEKAATDAERRRNNAILEQQQNTDEESRFSPTLSIGQESVSSANSAWPGFSDSVFDNNSGRFPPIPYESIITGSSSTSIFENLQAQLKQRDGEIQQLQWELSRRNTERDALNSELATLTLKIEDLSASVAEARALNESLNETQTRYDALLQMYGEKVEENQELRLDLEDVKEMYKMQIDQLLKRQN
ncbi:PREDICTED: TATA element modulatory factor-like [Vollenhovia emeryi]|uniref:TATA element modulatory factor-like n=1 Tax=Vollenhovia emeryi TaxID=411798 RepID=UPI0005F55ADF|nr:PREDICTED: TATA element modulatory factor-like [Vollenhovia emeryi]XP_011881932.1 PREDICTED: TATA element modulatory factor-like [Vollenhovia emeryi]XP_011881933.1 PREDICTED: TATA element modulatory factor-like [Vollenhovia emeryi]